MAQLHFCTFLFFGFFNSFHCEESNELRERKFQEKDLVVFALTGSITSAIIYAQIERLFRFDVGKYFGLYLYVKFAFEEFTLLFCL